MPKSKQQKQQEAIERKKASLKHTETDILRFADYAIRDLNVANAVEALLALKSCLRDYHRLGLECGIKEDELYASELGLIRGKTNVFYFGRGIEWLRDVIAGREYNLLNNEQELQVFRDMFQ